MTDSDGAATEAPFDRLFGPVRGLDDPRALRERLALTERELGLTMGRLAQSEKAGQRLQAEVDDLQARGREQQRRLEVEVGARAWSDYRSDTVRYALVRSGYGDIWVAGEDEHHGVWTPGRPYLSKHHVFHPETWACFVAIGGGASAGHRPGEGDKWEPCRRGGRCPEPPMIPRGSHPVSSGRAVRQDRHWWDKHGKQWGLSELTREHLLGVIDWLHEHIEELWGFEEARLPEVTVPCPANAYESADAWLADSPLMRALLTEKRRRRIRRSPTRHQGVGR